MMRSYSTAASVAAVWRFVICELLLLFFLLAAIPKCVALTKEEMEAWLDVFSAAEIHDYFSQQPQQALQIAKDEFTSSESPKNENENGNGKNLEKPEEELIDNESSPKYKYEHVVRRVDSKARCKIPSDALPVVVATTNREALVGCHSFHRHLNRRWRTVIVLNEGVAKNFGIDKMVENANCDDTLGATLLMLNNFGGEVLGRRVALDYTLKELPSDVEFLHQINCDVHPIPKRHKHYQSMETIVTRMTMDFLKVKELVANPSKRTNAIPSQFLKRPVLGMNALLFEEFPSMTQLEEEQLHGHDVCAWKGVSNRPNDLGRKYPWLCNNMDWVENHMMIFDIEKLVKVREALLDAPAKANVDSYPSSTKLTPAVAYNYDMVVLTNQDVYAHQNFARAKNHKEQSLPDVPDWLKVYSLETLASTRCPEMNYRAWHGYQKAGYTVRIGQTGIGFAIRQTESDDPSPWWPQNPTRLNENETFRLIRAMLKLCGYELIEQNNKYFVFEMLGAYPSDLIVLVSHGRSLDIKDSWEILQLENEGGEVIYYYAVGSVSTRKLRKLDPQDRLVHVPVNVKIQKIPGNPKPNDSIVLHNKGQFKPKTQNGEEFKRGMGECENDGSRVINCCGYLESPEW